MEKDNIRRFSKWTPFIVIQSLIVLLLLALWIKSHTTRFSGELRIHGKRNLSFAVESGTLFTEVKKYPTQRWVVTTTDGTLYHMSRPESFFSIKDSYRFAFSGWGFNDGGVPFEKESDYTIHDTLKGSWDLDHSTNFHIQTRSFAIPIWFLILALLALVSFCIFKSRKAKTSPRI